ncbi:MAG: cell envelope integrity protein CreD [Pseudomonadota bacterium]
MIVLDEMSRRFATIAFVALFMGLPLLLVAGIAEDRQQYYQEATEAVSRSWGPAPVLSGPVVVVPETSVQSAPAEPGGVAKFPSERQRVFLLDQLKMKISITHQYRQRAIYDVPVFTALIKIEGQLPVIEHTRFEDGKRTLHLDRAQLLIGINHPQAIALAEPVVVGNERFDLSPFNQIAGIGRGVKIPLPSLGGKADRSFATSIELRGSKSFAFTPFSRQSHVEMISTWPHPSFRGRYLPIRHEISDSGFSAEWSVGELALGVSSSWLVNESTPPIQSFAAGVGLYEPVNDYSQIDRALKYGLLFISLTFIGFICFEISARLKIHPVQYSVVGVALTLFFMSLLSLSEHLPFAAAYMIATLVIVTMVCVYVRAITRSLSLTMIQSFILLTLYGTLFVLLRLESFSLLVGTAVLLAALSALMVVTRRLAEASPNYS